MDKRFARAHWVANLWPLALAIPLAPFADRFCSLFFVDPLYHTALWIHERLYSVLAVGMLMFVVGACWRLIEVESELDSLCRFAARIDQSALEEFEGVREAVGVTATLVFLDISLQACFTSLFGRRVFITRGFLDRVDRKNLGMVFRHELLHVHRHDCLRAAGWRLLVSALFNLPVMRTLEQLCRQSREMAVHQSVPIDSGQERLYLQTLSKFSGDGRVSTMLRTKPWTTQWRSVGLASLATLASIVIAIALNHAILVRDLASLTTHHC